MNKKKLKLALLILISLVIVAIIILIIGNGNMTKKKSIGFILPGSINLEGYNSTHYKGISDACKNLNLNLIVKDNISDQNTGECAKAVKDLADKGVKIIILCSYGYQEEVASLLAKYPDISFYCSADVELADNYTFYFSRLYQARYLAGIIAGYVTKTNSIGYIAGIDNCEVNRGLNAFTLGVQKVNPNAIVHAIFINSWDDSEKESKAAKTLINDYNVDIITYHQNQDQVIQEAEAAGIYSIGYNIPTDSYSDNVLTSVMCDWENVYTKLLQDNLQHGKAVQKRYWYGIEDNAVYLYDYSPIISEEIKNKIISESANIKNGFDVFSGEIIDNNGNIRCKKGEIMSDESLMKNMNWYVKGVEIDE